MDKYSVGDKFVIEIAETIAGYKNNTEEPGALTVLHRIKGFNSLVFDKNGLDRLERLDSDYINENFRELQDKTLREGYNNGFKEGREKALLEQKDIHTAGYNKGVNDAWDLVKKIYLAECNGGYSCKKCDEVFGTCSMRDIFNNFTPQEALAKLEAYEREQADIKVGDVVRFKNTETKVLITAAHDFFAADDFLEGVCLQTDENGRKGEVHSGICKNDIEKTGKYLDIERMLSEIGKE